MPATTFECGGTGACEIYRQWYLDSHANQTDGTDVQSATVTCYNVSNLQVLSETTDASGDIVRQNVTQYRETSAGKVTEMNLTCNTTKAGFTKHTDNFNFSNQERNPVIDPISVTLLSINGLGNNSYINTATPYIEFNATASSVSNFSCTVWINDTFAFGTNSTVINGSATNITANATLGDGKHTAFINCTEPVGGSNISAIWNFTVTPSPPT